jgi:hypothetical protein
MWEILDKEKTTVFLKVLQDQLNDLSGLDLNGVIILWVDHEDKMKA